MVDSSSTPPISIAELMGRIYEPGFNIGILSEIEHRTDLTTHFQALYTDDLAKLHLHPLVEAAWQRTGTISEMDRETLQRWVQFLLFKGYLAGRSFLAEFLQMIHLSQKAGRQEDWKGDIFYLQCNFTGKNSLGLLPSPDMVQTTTQLLAQLTAACQREVTMSLEEIEQYQGRGEFLNADMLLLLKDWDGWRLLCVDLSIFGLQSLRDTHDLNRVESLRRLLKSDIRYLRTRSVFTNLSIDTNDEATAQEVLSGQLKQYFTAFKRQDKETAKFIQAASYTFSFYHFLVSKGVLRADDPIVFHVVGYTDRALNAMALKRSQLALLETCANIYRQHHSDEAIAEARQAVIGTIQRAANRSFTCDQPLATTLLGVGEQGDGLHTLTFQETLRGFVNTVDPLDPSKLSPELRQRLSASALGSASIRDLHRDLVYQELSTSELYLFLTGHPGIGKTSALVAFFKACAERGEGFLFLYVSPRKQVNLDILKKCEEDPACVNFFGITTNSLAIRKNGGRPTVHYSSALAQERFSANGVTFLPASHEENTHFQESLRKLEEIQENLLIDKGEQVSGVLKSLCQALAATVSEPFPPAHSPTSGERLPLSIVATVAIQSLKRTTDQQSTLKHLEQIFTQATANGKIIPEQMDQISQRLRHFVIMIDEVTGDEGGAEFIEGIHQFVQRYRLAEHGIHTKIIVADASIVDTDVIRSHLSTTGYEPHKIYFRRVDPALPASPLTREKLSFKHCPGVVINANAYPASTLQITYNVFTDIFPYNEEQYAEQYQVLLRKQQLALRDDIQRWMASDPEAQILVYIQDKQRLSELIGLIKEQQRFEMGDTQGYLEIHANISEKDKQEIKEHQDEVQVVFMTASASRGLSFKRAKHILVDIPHFAIEQNLMEILQVIYRGRGGEMDRDEKTLTFYLADRLTYGEQMDRDLTLKEQLLHLLNVLLILKTSILTRITGSGPLGIGQRFRMVPIGGKSIFSAGETFSKRLSDLIKELQDVAKRSWAEKKRLNTIASALQEMLAHSHIQLIRTSRTWPWYPHAPHSYLEVLPTLAANFSVEAERGFDRLLKLPPLEPAYLAGSLLIVPTQHKSLREVYRTMIEDILNQPRPADYPDLLTDMYRLSQDHRYPESLRASLHDAMLLMKEMQKLSRNRAAYYEQESGHDDQYYALPLTAFSSYKQLQAYFDADGAFEEQATDPFRHLLREYVRALYPADGFLPIGRVYQRFPFLLFRSFNLGEARQRLFTDKYLFTSQEFNIITMLLSGKGGDVP